MNICEKCGQHKLAMDAACGEIDLLQNQLNETKKAYEDLVRQVEIQLFYLDAQETGTFDPVPLMLRKADNDVRKSLENLKKVLDQGSD